MLSVSYISRESWRCVSLSLCSTIICANNNRVHYGPVVVFVSLHIALPHYHPYADVYESITLHKCLAGTFRRVCVQYPVIFLIKKYPVNFLNQLPCDDCENSCILSYYHHQIGNMNQLPLIRVRS